MKVQLLLTFFLLLLAAACAGDMSTPAVTQTPSLPTSTLAPTATTSRPTSPAATSTPTPLPPDPGVILYQNDPQRTGHHDYPAILDPAGVHWRADLVGQVFGAPMYAGGLLYVNGSNRIYVFDGQTGEQLATLDGLGLPFSPIAISGELLIAGATSPARLVAYDRHNQRQVWAFETAGEIYNSPLVVGQTVYAVSERGAYALDLLTGEVIWQTDTGDHRGFVGSPAYENGRLFASVGPSVFALDGATGEIHWQLDQQDDQWFYSPALANGWVYVGSDDGHFYALDQQTGEEKWQSQEAGIGWSAPVMTDDLVIVGNKDQHIYAFDALTGEERWRFETADWAVTDPVTSDGVVYVGVGNHENREGPRPLYALDAETGELLWSFEADSRLMTAATLAPGILYVVAVDGTVYALSSQGGASASVLQPGQWSALVYHEGLEQVVLVNGGPEQGKPADEPLELWGWNGELWTLLDDAGPVWRNWAGVAYDSDRDVLVVHGGLQANNEYFDETWEWDGQAWSQHDGRGPGGREGSGMVYDSGRGKTVLYGGAVAGPEIVGDTWEWDGLTWVQVAASGPPARFPAGTGYDPVHQQMLIYGGHDVRTSEEIPFFGDFWAWDGVEWSEQPLTEPDPGIRVSTSFAFDPVTEEILMFGGSDLEGFRTDLWGWDGGRWTLISDDTGMPARGGFNIVAYDPGRDVFVMFGGVDRPGGEIVGETWEWDRVTWRCAAGCED